jgi:hypothetical protein
MIHRGDDDAQRTFLEGRPVASSSDQPEPAPGCLVVCIHRDSIAS